MYDKESNGNNKSEVIRMEKGKKTNKHSQNETFYIVKDYYSETGEKMQTLLERITLELAGRFTCEHP